MYGSAISLAGKPSVIYTRISDDQAGHGWGVKRQDEDCDGLAEQLGIDPIEKFKENDLSAWKKTVHRPLFERTLRMIEKREIEVVIIYDMDRYLRQPRQLETLIEMGEKGNGIILAGVFGGILDLSTANGQHEARTRVARAAYESHRHSERRKRANIQKAERGEWECANRPFGYGDGKKNDDGTFVTAAAGEPYEPEAAAFRKAVRDVLSGKSIRGIAREWGEAGLLTTRGNTWTAAQIRYILVKPRYAALKAHQGKTYPGHWTPLIDESTHYALVRLLTSPERTSGRASWEQTYLGTGLYLCGICTTTTLQSSSGGIKRPTSYTCRTMKHLGCNTKMADDIVVGTILDFFAHEKCHELVKPAPKVDKLLEEDAKLQGELEQLAMDEAAGEMTYEMVRIMSKPRTDRRKDIKRELAAAVSTTTARTLIGVSQEARKAGHDALKAVTHFWATLSLTQQAQAIDEVATVTVKPVSKRSAGFDPTRVDVEPRHAKDVFAEPIGAAV